MSLQAEAWKMIIQLFQIIHLLVGITLGYIYVSTLLNRKHDELSRNMLTEMMGIGRRLTEWRHLLFPRLTTRSALAHYLPMAGALSHSLYSIHILSPDLLTRYFGVHDLAAEFSILCTATLGPGFAVYFRPHMNRLGRWKRVEMSVFTAVMFTYGSLFTVIFVKDLLPTTLKVWVKSLIAVGISWLLMSRGYQYLNFHDSRLKHRNNMLNGTPPVAQPSEQ